MEAGKFGFGLAAGLLLGVAIIAASGGLGAFSAGVSPNPTNTANGSAIVISSTKSVAVSTGTTSQPLQASVSNLSSGVTVATLLTPTSTATVNGSKAFLVSAATTPGYSSRVQSIEHQPLFTDAVVLIPVLLALLLGAVLYRASARSRRPNEDLP